jgi:hypothetical protein
MKNIMITVLLSVVVSSSNAQQSIDSIMKLLPQKIDFYENTADSFQIKMPYAKSTVETKNLPNKADLNDLVSIDLVYTEYRRSERFSQPTLNRYRLKTLQKVLPEVFKLENVKWNIIEQTGATDMNAAKELFHGFVFNFEEEVVSEEITYIRKIVNQTNEEEIDSTVLNVFDRNDWSDMLITADLTGSMSPYIAQVLLWFKLNNIDEKVKHFMFFNDGDDTPNEDKIVGKTGGLYQAKAKDFKTIERLAYETIKNGNGGDSEENDMEALYFGIQNCPECKDIILIADNNSPVRDWRMMELIKKPVRIILCGVEGRAINTHYLDLARVTKGSIHTIEQDITQLVNINEGQSIKIEDRIYKIYKGSFVLKSN